MTWKGTVESIYIASAARGPLKAREQVVALPGVGLEGDRYVLDSPGGKIRARGSALAHEEEREIRVGVEKAPDEVQRVDAHPALDPRELPGVDGDSHSRDGVYGRTRRRETCDSAVRRGAVAQMDRARVS